MPESVARSFDPRAPRRAAWPWLVALGLALMFGGVAAALLAWSPAASVSRAADPTLSDVARASALVRMHNPRRALPGIERHVLLSARDLQFFLAQAARRLDAEPRVAVDLTDRRATLRASLPLARAMPQGMPDALQSGWLNIELQLAQTAQWPEIAALQVGRLNLPTPLLEWLWPPAVRALGLEGPLALAQDMVRRVRFGPARVDIAFAWPDEAERRLAEALVAPQEQARVKFYAEQLATLTRQLHASAGPGGEVPLPQVMQPMFELARQQSLRSGQPEKENRAALLALVGLVNGRSLGELMASPDTAPRALPITVTLAGRSDTPKHYLVSAALALEGGGPLSDAIGLYKEVSDSRGGSGFSFNDLAADRAGTRFGLLAARSPGTLQARLAAGVVESDLLPLVSDLPEDLQERVFQRRFGGIDGPAYRDMLVDIENRLDQLPLLATPAPAGVRG